MERDRVFSEVRAEAEETVVTLKVRTEAEWLLCEVRTEAWERVVTLTLSGHYWICRV